jgi:hypothetical protein
MSQNSKNSSIRASQHKTKEKSTASRRQPCTPLGRPDDPEQSRAFIEKAREIGADDRRSAADKLMGKLAKMKPEPRKGK